MTRALSWPAMAAAATLTVQLGSMPAGSAAAARPAASPDPGRSISLAAPTPTPAPAPAPGAALPPIRLSYALYGHGFHVMDLTVDLLLSPDAYSVRLNDHTTGLLGFMLRTDVTSTAQGRFVGNGVQPVRFASTGYSRGARRQTQLDYADGNPTVTLQTPPETRRDPVPIAQARGSIDTLSAIVDLIRSVSRSGRCDGNALVFDGLRLSQARSQTSGEQAVPMDHDAVFGGPALRCDFVSQQVAGFLHNDDETQLHRPQHGTAWVNRVLPDAPPLPVRIMFDHPKLGVATLVLTRVDTGAAGRPSPGG